MNPPLRASATGAPAMRGHDSAHETLDFARSRGPCELPVTQRIQRRFTLARTKKNFRMASERGATEPIDVDSNALCVSHDRALARSSRLLEHPATRRRERG